MTEIEEGPALGVGSMIGRPVPGYNVDPIDVTAGLRMLTQLGWPPDLDEDTLRTREVITYALQRHARGEEAAAEKAAIDKRFYGIDFTSWRAVLAAAIAAGAEQLKRDQNPRTFDAMLGAAFEAGRNHALYLETGGVGAAPAPDFDEWKAGFLP